MNIWPSDRQILIIDAVTVIRWLALRVTLTMVDCTEHRRRALAVDRSNCLA
jgi:hypothetical protein